MFKNLRIRKMLIVTFLSVTVISSIGGIIGLCVMEDMSAGYSGALSDYGFAQGDIGLFNTEFNSNSSRLRDIINSNDYYRMSGYLKELDQSTASMNAYFLKMKNEMVGKKEQGYYSDIGKNLTAYSKVRDKVVSLAKDNQTTQAQSELTSEGEPLSEKIRELTNNLISEKTVSGNRLSAALASQAADAKAAILVIIAASVAVSMLISLKISKSISRPVREIADSAKKMADGDLDIHVTVNSKNEIGQLASAFNETIGNFKAYIKDIGTQLDSVKQGDLTEVSGMEYKGDFSALQQSIQAIIMIFSDTVAKMLSASEQVLSGSQQVSAASQSLAQGANEQSGSIQELSGTISDISVRIKNNAKHAAEAKSNVDEASSGIDVSNRHMGEMVAAMTRISDSSSRIGKITKTIENITFQTNILALNAAVEAARAGEAGKGFAVVADEVRNLANKSAEAAKSISGLIGSAMREVENGTKIAGDTAESLHRAVESVKTVDSTVKEIATASKQQMEAMEQVTRAIEDISDVMQTNSATAEESAAASENLFGQAQSLKNFVKKFRLKAD